MKLAELLKVDTTKENWFKLLSKKGINPKTVNVVKSGASITEAPFKDVNFYDYDGTILYSYDADEFLKLTALPELKDKEGLISDGWNYTLEEAKELVQDVHMADIGALYRTDDNSLRYYFELLDYQSLDVKIIVSSKNSPYTIKIDWGDGIVEENLNKDYNKYTHKYSDIGKYCIKVYTMSEESYITIGGGASGTCFSPIRYLKKVELPDRIYLHQYTFDNANSLETISFPRNVSAWNATNQLSNCISLKHITCPLNIATIPSLYQSSIKSISIPKGVTSITCGYCANLKSLIFPINYTTIKSSIYSYCKKLLRLGLPSTITKTNSNSPLESVYKVKLGENIKGLYSSEFYQYKSLVYIKYPKNIDIIPCMKQCDNLLCVDLTEVNKVVPPGDKKYSMFGTDTKVVLPYELFDQYVNNEDWKPNKQKFSTNLYPKEVINIEISATDLPASGGYVYITVSAVCNGNQITDNKYLTNVNYKCCDYYKLGVSPKNFPANTSTEPKSIEISYTLCGVTATTTITQAGAEVTE